MRYFVEKEFTRVIFIRLLIIIFLFLFVRQANINLYMHLNNIFTSPKIISSLSKLVNKKYNEYENISTSRYLYEYLNDFTLGDYFVSKGRYRFKIENNMELDELFYLTSSVKAYYGIIDSGEYYDSTIYRGVDNKGEIIHIRATEENIINEYLVGVIRKTPLIYKDTIDSFYYFDTVVFEKTNLLISNLFDYILVVLFYVLVLINIIQFTSKRKMPVISNILRNEKNYTIFEKINSINEEIQKNNNNSFLTRTIITEKYIIERSLFNCIVVYNNIDA